MFKKIIAWLHLWLGLFSGLVVLVVSITGCIYVFHEEFLAWFPQGEDKLELKQEIKAEGRLFLKPSEVLEKVEMQASAGKDKIKAKMIRYFPDKPSLLLSEEHGVDEHYWYIFDPYTGELFDQRIETPYGVFQVKDGLRSRENMRGFQFFPFILQGHMTLWLPSAIGQPIVAYGTLVFVILLISGLVLWWPKSKAAAKQRFWFKWKPMTRWRRKNYDLHNVNGFYMFLFLFLIGFTGLCIGLRWVSNGVNFLLGGESEVVYQSKVPKDGKSVVEQIYLLDDIFLKEQQAYGKLKMHSMYWAYPSINDPNATTMTVAYTDEETYRSNYDRYSLKKLATEDEHDHDDESLAHQVEHLYLPIHEGSIGGLPTKILAFVASFISASLPVTGFYIWWGRRNKKNKKKV